MNFKKDFPIFENRDISYLDSGATSQKPQYVINAVEEFYKKFNANPHRGAYSLSLEATEQYENTRIWCFAVCITVNKVIYYMFFKLFFIVISKMWYSN